jgi:hypothetical protein
VEQAMNYEITKLDRRHAWHGQFAYMIEFKKSRSWNKNTSTGVLEFDRARRWFNEKFGWSQDVETRSQIGAVRAQLKEDYTRDFNLYWAYSIKYNEYRIYVQSDKELNWFVLGHPVSHD